MQAQTEDANQRLENQVTYAYLRGAFSDDSDAFKDLEDLTQKPAVAWRARHSIAQLLVEKDLPDRALAEYKMAEQLAEDDSQLVRTLAGRARALSELGRTDEALGELSNGLTHINDAVLRKDMYLAIADLYEEKDDWLKRALALSKAVELAPTDSNLRFRVGYAYSQSDYEDLALLHYTATVGMDNEDSAARNNAGVAYERLNMPIHSIRRYREAADRKNSLADANLATRLMSAGFADEAKEILTKAAAEDDPHPNVAHHISHLSELEEAERKTKKATIARAHTKDDFFRSYADALLVSSPRPELAGAWAGGTRKHLARPSNRPRQKSSSAGKATCPDVLSGPSRTTQCSWSTKLKKQRPLGRRGPRREARSDI